MLVTPTALPNRLPINLLPAAVRRAGEQASRRFAEFFVAQIANPHTRASYGRAVARFFAWCEAQGIGRIELIDPLAVAAYFREHPGSAPTIKQHLAAVRMLFNWMATGGFVAHNPAAPVRGPRHVVVRGRTPVLSVAACRQLLDSIDGSTLIGLRDRALISVMTFSFARVGAVIAMRVGDYGRPDPAARATLRLREKGGKEIEAPAHHLIAQAMNAYLLAARLGAGRNVPLFQSAVGRSDRLTGRPLHRNDVLQMVKRRVRGAGLPADRVCCHTFRATGITAYLENGGRLEHAQRIAAHASPLTTKLYDRTADTISADEIERILI